ncbi:hypothetical protein [Candidatus Formimonas warabiya]|nr:hypothetical protein [Candidatus Formimonas warabiya]
MVDTKGLNTWTMAAIIFCALFTLVATGLVTYVFTVIIPKAAG